MAGFLILVDVTALLTAAGIYGLGLVLRRARLRIGAGHMRRLRGHAPLGADTYDILAGLTPKPNAARRAR